MTVYCSYLRLVFEALRTPEEVKHDNKAMLPFSPLYNQICHVGLRSFLLLSVSYPNCCPEHSTQLVWNSSSLVLSRRNSLDSAPCEPGLYCPVRVRSRVCLFAVVPLSRLFLRFFSKHQSVPSSPHFPSDPAFTRFSTADASPLPSVPDHAKDHLPFPTCQWLPHRGVHVSERRTYGFDPNVVDIERYEFLSTEGCLPQHLFRGKCSITQARIQTSYDTAPLLFLSTCTFLSVPWTLALEDMNARSSSFTLVAWRNLT